MSCFVFVMFNHEVWQGSWTENTVLWDGNASDSYFAFTGMFITDSAGACLRSYSETFLLFSIIQRLLKKHRGKKACLFLLPVWWHMHLGSDTSWSRGQLEPGGCSLEAGAWSQALIFLGAYLSSYSSASSDWYTLPLVLHISASLIPRLITATKCVCESVSI